jgi:hypothetical protein
VKFNEIDLFGVYFAPIAFMMAAAWLAMIPLRRLADRTGVMRRVWHPALFEFAVYTIVLSCIILFSAR